MLPCPTYSQRSSSPKNRRENDNLEQQVQALFKAWFVDFEPFGGQLPDNWVECNLSDILTVRYGKDHKTLKDGAIPVYGSGGIMRFVNKVLYDKESVLIPRKGTLNNLFYVDEPFWSVDTMFFTEMKKMNIAKYIFLYLQRVDLESMNCGSAIPSMTTHILNGVRAILPSDEVLMKFDNTISSIFAKLKSLQKESTQLASIRDTLLPKLMSGELKLTI